MSLHERLSDTPADEPRRPSQSVENTGQNTAQLYLVPSSDAYHDLEYADPFFEKIQHNTEVWQANGLDVGVMTQAYVYDMVTTDDVNSFNGVLALMRPYGPEQALEAAQQQIGEYQELIASDQLPDRARELLKDQVYELQLKVEGGVAAFSDVKVKQTKFRPDLAESAKAQILMRLAWESSVAALPDDIKERLGGLHDAFAEHDFTTEESFTAAYTQWQEFKAWIAEQFEKRDGLKSVIDQAHKPMEAVIAAD